MTVKASRIFRLAKIPGNETARAGRRDATFCLLLAAVALLAAVPTAQARNTEYKLKLAEVLQDPEVRQKLPDGIAFYFGAQHPPAIERALGEAAASRKASAFLKTDTQACRNGLAAALLDLANRARSLGGDAVIAIESDYRGAMFASETEYECHAGGSGARVGLKGRVVKLRR